MRFLPLPSMSCASDIMSALRQASLPGISRKRLLQPPTATGLQNLETLRRSYKLEAQSIGQEEMGRLVGNTWRGMGSTERAPYERVANDELSRYMDSKRTFEALHRHYSALHYGAQEAGKKPRRPSFLHARHIFRL